MKPGLDPIAAPLQTADGPPARPRVYTPGVTDGLGDRLLMFDASTATSLELLRIKREFSDWPGFETALRTRVDELSHMRHPSLATLRTVEWLGAGEGLALVSTHIAGRRLSEILPDAHGAAFALEFIRQLAPALAALHQQGPGLAHGVLTADRIVVTREGRLVIVEHALGSAVESLWLPANRLRVELGLAVLSNSHPIRLDGRADVVQLGVIALSLLIGRRVDPIDYPSNIIARLDEFTNNDPLTSLRLRPWLEGALQLAGHPFASAQDAYQAFTNLPDVEFQPIASPRATIALPEQPQRPLAMPSDHASDIHARVSARSDAATIAGTENDAAENVEDDAGAVHQSKAVARDTRWLRRAVPVVALVSVAIALVIGGLIARQHPAVSRESGAVLRTRPSELSVLQPVAIAPVTAIVPSDAPSTAAITTSASALAPDKPVANPVEPVALPQPRPSVESSANSAPVSSGRLGGIKLASPIDLQVFEGGALVGSTAGPIAIADGSHALDLVNDTLGYRAHQTVEVKAGQMTTLPVAVPNGIISINATPWADVFIDGASAGETPIANLPVPIGTHDIAFRHPQLGEQHQTAVVKTEGLTRVSVNLQP